MGTYTEGVSYVYSLPIKDRLNSCERERFVDMYNHYKEMLSYTKSEVGVAILVSKMELLITMFGKEMFE